MVDFPAVNRLVAIGDKVLRQRDNVRIQVAKVRRVLDHADRIGTGTRHQAGSRRTADRLLAVGAIESQTLCRQSVQIGAFGDRRTVTT